jgi:NADH-quinone oxidoreductase subunit N
LPLLATVAVFSMILGNVAALAQTSVKRLLAYSAIAHAGYALLGIMAHDQHGLASVIYYAITYGFAVVGAFSVVSIVEDLTGGDKLENFTGLSRLSPVLALCLLVFILSLAGIPPLAGFFGKFYVFTAAVAAEPKSLGLLWLVILAIGTSAVSLYYYLQILKRVYVAEPSVETTVVTILWIRQAAIVLLALIVLVLGCFPDFLLQHIAAAFIPVGQ